MYKIILSITLFLISLTIAAQLKTPQPSPKCTVNQVVGLTDVSIEYSRPSAKGRIVFGDLVPFGKLWRTGANASSTISFSDDVQIGGNTLKKGKYAIYTIPKVESWEVIFYSESDNWGTPEKWDESKVALRTTVTPVMTERKVESFTIGIDNLDNNFAHLIINWERTVVAVRFDVPTKKIVEKNIQTVMAGPSAGDYFKAAQYYYQSDIEMNTALTYINKALELNKDKPYWYYRQKSLIQAKLGDKKGAIESAKLSLDGATKDKNDDYVKMNNDSIAEWSKK